MFRVSGIIRKVPSFGVSFAILSIAEILVAVAFH